MYNYYTTFTVYVSKMSKKLILFTVWAYHSTITIQAFSTTSRKIIRSPVFAKKMSELSNIHQCLESSFTEDIRQDLSDKIHAIQCSCKGDGAGLTCGSLVDMLISETFQQVMGPHYTEHHVGESDMILCDVPLSLKTIKAKSTIALDWSKNPTESTREHFAEHIMILNTQSGVWWKKSPKQKSQEDLTYSDMVPAGFYLVDKEFCKQNIKLSSNNKTNTLIQSQDLYWMLQYSRSQGLSVTLPIPQATYQFRMSHAFAMNNVQSAK
jgi:hypothetical protein